MIYIYSITSGVMVRVLIVVILFLYKKYIVSRKELTIEIASAATAPYENECAKFNNAHICKHHTCKIDSQDDHKYQMQQILGLEASYKILEVHS